MKAHIPTKLTNKTRQEIKKHVGEAIRERQNSTVEIMIMATACVMVKRYRFGAKRLPMFIQYLYEEFTHLGDYDDSAKFKCRQILHDAGFNWDEYSGGEINNPN